MISCENANKAIMTNNGYICFRVCVRNFLKHASGTCLKELKVAHNEHGEGYTLKTPGDDNQALNMNNMIWQL